MIFEKTAIDGLYIITLDPIIDNRGFFARSFCQREFENHGLKMTVCQCNVSYNEKKGTLRGMHYQMAPYTEEKLVSCVRGAIYDVAVDLRKESQTYGKWVGVELTAENRKAFYIPAGFAHGFQTLVDHTDVLYLMGNYYFPEASTGISASSSLLNIVWPISNKVISENDNRLPEMQ